MLVYLSVKYLSILDAPFTKLGNGTLKDLSVVVPGLVRTLAMVWSSSKSYNSAVRMVGAGFACIVPECFVNWVCSTGTFGVPLLSRHRCSHRLRIKACGHA
jgi:Dynein heavy chain, N-terminal region 1